MENFYDGIPLPDDPGDEGYFSQEPPALYEDQPVGDSSGPSNSNTIQQTLLDAWYEVTAFALNSGTAVDRASQMLKQLRGATVIYRALGKQGNVLLRAISHASAVLGDVQYGQVWASDLGLLDTRRVEADVVDVLVKVVGTNPTERPESRLGGAVALARKEWTRNKSRSLINAIDSGLAPEKLAAAHADIVDAPPTALDESTATDENAGVSALFSGSDEDTMGITLSSGFPSLDVTLSTRDGFPRGYCRSGQLCVFVAPSGSGKTSAFNTIVPAGVIDAKAQGSRGRTLYVHNEDDTADLFAGMSISPGKRYSHLVDDIAFLKTTSREEFVKFFYREVLRAKRMHVETGLPTSLFMPPALFVDYYQALSSPNDRSEADGTANSADLLLYGIANCDPVAIRSFGGVGFQEYTGEAWPEGLDSYGIAVVVTAQLLLKGTSSQAPFNPDKKDVDWRVYAAADAHDNPAWTPRPGDYPMAKLDDIRGSTKVIQHATTIIGLHRPRPRNNPETGTNAAGYPTLADSRGYFTILKARFGQRMLVVPMEFNRQRNGGSKTQYFDAAAEAALSSTETAFPVDREVFKMTGDPIIPVRPRRTAMGEVKY